jgi:hypothetical protein
MQAEVQELRQQLQAALLKLMPRMVGGTGIEPVAPAV